MQKAQKRSRTSATPSCWLARCAKQRRSFGRFAAGADDYLEIPFVMRSCWSSTRLAERLESNGGIATLLSKLLT